MKEAMVVKTMQISMSWTNIPVYSFLWDTWYFLNVKKQKKKWPKVNPCMHYNEDWLWKVSIFGELN